MKNNNLNPYTITWAILTPVKGKATKRDLHQMNAVNSFSLIGKEVAGHFPNIEKARTFISEIMNLSKSYEVVFITDKQFGLVDLKSGFRIVATKKQLQDRFFI